MNAPPPTSSTIPATTQPVADEGCCKHCGRPEAHLLDDLWICDDCYSAMGSCCAGESCEGE